MLKSYYRWFNEVLSSQMKLCRVKQREAHEVISTNGMFFLSEMICHPFYRERLPAACVCVCVLSFVDSKAQLRYLGSPNTAVPDLRS